jgi:hypothetical protein
MHKTSKTYLAISHVQPFFSVAPQHSADRPSVPAGEEHWNNVLGSLIRWRARGECVLMVDNKHKVRRSTICIDVETTDDPLWDSVFVFLLCCTEQYVLALLEDLNEFAWNKVKDKLASLDLYRTTLVHV